MKTFITIIASSIVTILIMNDWISGIYKKKFAEWKKYKLIPFDDYAKKQMNEVKMYKYLENVKKTCAASELTIVGEISDYFDDLTKIK